MGILRAKRVVIISIIGSSLLLTGCGKKEVPQPPVSNSEALIEVDDGETHKFVYMDADGIYYSYYVQQALKTPIYDMEKTLEKAYTVEENTSVKIVGDIDIDLDPFELGANVEMIAPHQYSTTALQQRDFYGKISKSGYSMKQMYRCQDYADYLFKRGDSRIRVIFQKDGKLRIFYNIPKILNSSDTYISGRMN